MANWNFIINKNKSAERCDICHKSDLFDPATGVCQRCQQLPTAQLELLANPQIYSIYSIPASRVASIVASIFAVLCLAAGLVSLQLFFRVRVMVFFEAISLSAYFALLTLNLINFPLSIALNRWCSDQYNERLDYRVVVLGRICSFVGLSGSLIGVAIAIPRLLSLINYYFDLR